MSANWTTLSLSTDQMEIVLLPGVGGRIWDIVFRGEQLLFRNPDLEGAAFDIDNLAVLPTRSPHFGFPLWGGEKTWVAPDSNWPGAAPHVTLDSGAYTIENFTTSEVLMASARCPISGLRVSRRIKVQSGQSFDITHSVANEGDNSRETGVWSVMMLNHPSTIAVASSRPEVLPVFGEAGDQIEMNSRASICTCNREAEFKVGLGCDTGLSLMRVGTTPVWLSCQTEPRADGDTFLHGQPCEVFNSGDYAYCEAEWHSPAKTLAPGEAMNFTQHFELSGGKDTLPETAKHQKVEELMACML